MRVSRFRNIDGGVDIGWRRANDRYDGDDEERSCAEIMMIIEAGSICVTLMKLKVLLLGSLPLFSFAISLNSRCKSPFRFSYFELSSSNFLFQL